MDENILDKVSFIFISLFLLIMIRSWQENLMSMSHKNQLVQLQIFKIFFWERGKKGRVKKKMWKLQQLIWMKIWKI